MEKRPCFVDKTQGTQGIIENYFILVVFEAFIVF